MCGKHRCRKYFICRGKCVNGEGWRGVEARRGPCVAYDDKVLYELVTANLGSENDQAISCVGHQLQLQLLQSYRGAGCTLHC
jgi:hypothetical protein